jgi:uridine kinase
VVDLLAARPATLGTGRLVCVDGPAGSGKTTLAAGLAARTGAGVVHLDDLYAGWDGLATVAEHVLGVLAPLAEDRPGRYRRWDWTLAARAEEHAVAPAPLLVLEGVGAGGLAWAPWCTVLVWVEADAETRLARGLARDGADLRAHWDRWMEQEQAVFARQRTRARADLVVPT